jgi:hypothetical protein
VYLLRQAFRGKMKVLRLFFHGSVTQLGFGHGFMVIDDGQGVMVARFAA